MPLNTGWELAITELERFAHQWLEPQGPLSKG